MPTVRQQLIEAAANEAALYMSTSDEDIQYTIEKHIKKPDTPPAQYRYYMDSSEIALTRLINDVRKEAKRRRIVQRANADEAKDQQALIRKAIETLSKVFAAPDAFNLRIRVQKNRLVVTYQHRDFSPRFVCSLDRRLNNDTTSDDMFTYVVDIAVSMPSGEIGLIVDDKAGMLAAMSITAQHAAAMYEKFQTHNEALRIFMSNADHSVYIDGVWYHSQ